MYNSIYDQNDRQTLQDDLSKLVHWSTIWQLPFNLTKCEHLIVTNKSPSIHHYLLGNQIINKVQSAKYLGLTITNNMSWSTHISRIIGRANSALAFFRRNFGQCMQEVKAKCYQTYIRPILEYAAVIWSPYMQTYIQQVEMIQRKAARFIFSDYSRFASVSTILSKLNWQLLEKRRNNLCEFSTTLKLGPNIPLTLHYFLVQYEGDSFKNLRRYKSLKLRILKSYETPFRRASHKITK